MKISSLEENLLRSLDGDLSANEKLALRDKLDDSKELQTQWTELSTIKASLEKKSGLWDDVDLSESFEKSLAEESQSPSHRKRVRQKRMWWFTSLAMSLGLVLFLGTRTYKSSSESEFRKKSASLATKHKGAGLFVYKIGQNGTVEPLENTLGPDDDLAFAYTNLGPDGFTHLMIFAIDSLGMVHWMYPSQSDDASGQTSLNIPSGKGMVELPDQISSPFSAGTLRVFALFTYGALAVSVVEENIIKFNSDLESEWPALSVGHHVLEKTFSVRGAK